MTVADAQRAYLAHGVTDLVQLNDRLGALIQARHGKRLSSDIVRRSLHCSALEARILLRGNGFILTPGETALFRKSIKDVFLSLLRSPPPNGRRWTRLDIARRLGLRVQYVTAKCKKLGITTESSRDFLQLEIRRVVGRNPEKWTLQQLAAHIGAKTEHVKSTCWRHGIQLAKPAPLLERLRSKLTEPAPDGITWNIKSLSEALRAAPTVVKRTIQQNNLRIEHREDVLVRLVKEALARPCPSSRGWSLETLQREVPSSRRVLARVCKKADIVLPGAASETLAKSDDTIARIKKALLNNRPDGRPWTKTNLAIHLCVPRDSVKRLCRIHKIEVPPPGTESIKDKVRAALQGVPPNGKKWTVAQLSAHLGISKPTILKHLRSIQSDQ